MSGSTAVEVLRTPTRLIEIARSQSAGSESTKRPPLSQPALLTNASIRPNRSRTCATIESTESRDVTSVGIARAPWPIASAVSAAVVPFTSVTTTVASSAANFRAIARPMP